MQNLQASTFLSVDQIDSLSNGLAHKEAPAFSYTRNKPGITEVSMAHTSKERPMPLTHMGSLRSESCMRIQSMLISILFVAPFSDGSSTKFKSMG